MAYGSNYLLKEDASKVLQEDGTGLLLESSYVIKFIEPGSDATFNVATTTNGGFWDSKFGSITSDTTQFHSGTRSIKFAVVSGNFLEIFKNNILADAGRRISFYFFTDTIPANNLSLHIFEIGDSGDNASFGLTLNNAGKLVINDKNNVAQATGTTILSVNTWYRVSMTYTVTNSTTNLITVYLNGIQEVTATNITVVTGTLVFNLGSNNFSFLDTLNFWIDDIYIDDGQSGDTGNILVTAKRPFSNGTTNNFTTQIGSGSSGYGTGHSSQVNERPLSTTNGWSMIGAGIAVTEEYNIENQSTGDIDITGSTIVDYIGWAYMSSLSGETVQMIVNGVNFSQSITSTNKMYTKVAGSTSYPAGTGTDIGITTDTSLTTVSLYECGIVVAYITATPPPIISPLQSLMLLGVGT